jgi:hypothetical protein
VDHVDRGDVDVDDLVLLDVDLVDERARAVRVEDLPVELVADDLQLDVGGRLVRVGLLHLLDADDHEPRHDERGRDGPRDLHLGVAVDVWSLAGSALALAEPHERVDDDALDEHEDDERDPEDLGEERLPVMLELAVRVGEELVRGDRGNGHDQADQSEHAEQRTSAHPQRPRTNPDPLKDIRPARFRVVRDACERHANLGPAALHANP